MITVLIIDDEDKLRNLLSRIIGLEGFTVLQAGDIKTGMKKLEQSDIDVVICDVMLPDGNGVEACKKIKQLYPQSEIILLTAHGNISDGVQAMKNGAFDYITKGDDNDKIIPLLHRAAEKVKIQKRLFVLENQVNKKYSFENIIGSSKSLQDAVMLAKKVSTTEATVLLLGETGTGKEVFANAIHSASTRANKPFVAINCSAFSKEILESELFGHKAGAFTGALKDKKGLFEEADTGTVFLDEIGEMQLELQAKLLRVLETGEFIKVGDTRTTKADIRFIAATNKQLKKEAEAGHFREDLFYRLSVFQIYLPALRERVLDIEVLAAFFVDKAAITLGKKKPDISDEYLQILKQQPWKGNIRELKNIIERSVILLDEDTLTADVLPFDMLRKVDQQQQIGVLSAFDLAGAEKLHIQKVLNHTKGNKTEAARLLNIGLTTLYRKIEEYKMN